MQPQRNKLLVHLLQATIDFTMKLLLLFVAILTANLTTAQQKYTMQKDPETGEPLLKGPISFSDLEQESAYDWMKSASSYKPGTQAINYLGKNLPKYDLIVVMGTWCSDSHLLIPQLYSVLSHTVYPLRQLQLFGADRNKEFGDGLKEKYRIVSVPTVIVYEAGVEIGRITETVRKSVEEDLVEIVSKNK